MAVLVTEPTLSHGSLLHAAPHPWLYHYSRLLSLTATRGLYCFLIPINFYFYTFLLLQLLLLLLCPLFFLNGQKITGGKIECVEANKNKKKRRIPKLSH